MDMCAFWVLRLDLPWSPGCLTHVNDRHGDQLRCEDFCNVATIYHVRDVGRSPRQRHVTVDAM